MTSISGTLITVRTGRQGAAMEKGKFTPEYLEETAMLSVSTADLERLGLGPNKRARIGSSQSEVIVTCRAAEGPRGIFFMPLGPTANLLIGGETQGTGVPDYKGIAVTLAPEEEVAEPALARKE